MRLTHYRQELLMSAEPLTFVIPDWLNPAHSPSATLSLFDELVVKLSDEPVASSEKSLLDKAFWSQGVTLRLREDSRFEQSPWGNWLVVDDSAELINDRLYGQFLEGEFLHATIIDCLEAAEKDLEGKARFCPADPRFKRSGDELRLNPSLLSREPHFTDDPGAGRYVTHLPFYALKVIAASEPAGEWGARAEDHDFKVDDAVPPDSWIRVELAGMSLNKTMFVSRLQGESMDDGRRGLSDGALVVFGYWPKGSRQDSLVVVRGAFNDPEMGSFAFKEYHADARDEQGEHHQITLRSLNSDKQRYPDIHLKPDQDDDLVVVAEYLRVLGERDYVRAVKPEVPADERDIQGEDELVKRQKRLSSIHDKVFQTGVIEGKEDVNVNLSGLEWICLSAEQGGAALSISPLPFLPRFIKKLELRYGEETAILLASNHRNHPRLKSVSPGEQVYSLLPPVEFEEDFDSGEFDSWVMEGMDVTQVHWFRVDASGVGRKVSGNSWSEGSTYRALAVSSLLTAAPAGLISPLSDGWSMVEVELTDEPPKWLSTLMGKMNATQKTCRLSWVDQSPVSWRATISGDELAVFNREAPPVISIQLEPKFEADIKPGALVILHNGERAEKLILKDRCEWRLQLADLQVGSYVLQVVPADKKIQPAYMPFVISNESLLTLPPARFNLQAYRADNEQVDHEDLLQPLDWTLQDGQLMFCDEVTVLLPPWWPLRIQLHTSVYQFYSATAADEFGCLNLVEALAKLAPHMEYLAAASITLDAGELGTIQLTHSRKLIPESMHAVTCDLWNDFKQRKDQLLTEPELLFQGWVVPLFREWRGRLELMPDEQLLQQDKAKRLYQWVNCEWEDSKVQAHSVPLLLIGKDCDVEREDSLRVACERYLQGAGKRRMLVTDGLRFAEIRRNTRLKLRWFEMDAMVVDQDLFEAWLGELEGGA
jgi:hypothetical protein